MEPQLLQLIKSLDEYYNRKNPMGEGLIRIYAESLSDLDIKLLEKVVTDWIKNGKPFMPKVSELRAGVERIHVDRFIDGRRVVASYRDYYQTEDFTENGYRVTYRVLKPCKLDPERVEQ